MSNALTSVDNVKDRIGLTKTTFDALISKLILSVSSRIEMMCNRDFTLATYTNELHDGSDLFGSSRTILIPRNAPISNVASIEYKTGSNSSPTWVAFTEDQYTVSASNGIIYFNSPVPGGKQNIRITYTAGWDGYDVITSSLWNFNVTPTGTVDGSNLTFTLPEDANEVIVYADGVRLQASDVTHTDGSDTITLASGTAPHDTIAVDYKATPADSGSDPTLPMEIVDLCERVVIALFKRRESEGKSSESFQESSIQWRASLFTKEDLATIKNYRRGYDL